MKSRTFQIQFPPNNNKILVYGDLKIPIDYDLFKRNSNYFQENNDKEIHILKEEGPNKISEKSIRDFVSCCQNQPIDINLSNILDLHYLAKKYKTEKLLEATTHLISEYKDKLALESILFAINMNNNQNLTSLNIQAEEEIISNSFYEYINDDRLVNLDLPILYRIIKKHFQKKEQESKENQELFDNFLIKLIKMHKRRASIFLSFLNIDKNKVEKLVELQKLSPNDFDPSFLNVSLFDTTIELVQQKNELSKKIDEMSETIEQLKKDKKEIVELMKNQNQVLLDELQKVQNEVIMMKNH